MVRATRVLRGSMILGLAHAVAMLLTVPVGVSAASVAPALSVQGRLTDENGVNKTDGDYPVAFKIWSDKTGTDAATQLKWVETRTVHTTNGNFSTVIGRNRDDATPSVYQTLADVFDGGERYLGITVSGESEMVPRQELNFVPYAIRALSTLGATGNVVSEILSEPGRPDTSTTWTEIPSVPPLQITTTGGRLRITFRAPIIIWGNDVNFLVGMKIDGNLFDGQTAQTGLWFENSPGYRNAGKRTTIAFVHLTHDPIPAGTHTVAPVFRRDGPLNVTMTFEDQGAGLFAVEEVK